MSVGYMIEVACPTGFQRVEEIRTKIEVAVRRRWPTALFLDPPDIRPLDPKTRLRWSPRRQVGCSLHLNAERALLLIEGPRAYRSIEIAVWFRRLFPDDCVAEFLDSVVMGQVAVPRNASVKTVFTEYMSAVKEFSRTFTEWP